MKKVKLEGGKCEMHFFLGGGGGGQNTKRGKNDKKGL